MKNYALINKCISVQGEFWEPLIFKLEYIQPMLSYVDWICIGEILLSLITFSYSSLLFLLFHSMIDRLLYCFFDSPKI